MVTAPAPRLPLPKEWPKAVRAAVLHVVGLARIAVTATRSFAANSQLERVRLRSRLEEAEAEVALLREELRIKDARLCRIEPRSRPHYPPAERLAILALRAAQGWTLAATARRFLIEAKTLASWMRRMNEQGEGALVQTVVPVNRFPELVAESVRQLKAVCPLLGKKGLAERLARAGLHLGVTTVGRMLKQAAAAPAAAKVEETEERSAPLRRPVVALYPGHAFQIDLTLVPTAAGFWVPWWPFSVLLRWPFAWWVAAVIDTSSRKVVAVRVFGEEPNARAMTEVVALAIEHSGLTPRYLLADKGRQFVAEEFRAFCEGEGVTVRYAAADSLGATAIIERFFRTLKTEWLRRIPIPLRADAFSAAIRKYLAWYHAERPHQGLGGRTPDEVFAGVRPKNEAPRIEPRPKWPRGAPCARPYAKPRRTNRRGLPRMVVGFAGGARELPTVSFVERR